MFWPLTWAPFTFQASQPSRSRLDIGIRASSSPEEASSAGATTAMASLVSEAGRTGTAPWMCQVPNGTWQRLFVCMSVCLSGGSLYLCHLPGHSESPPSTTLSLHTTIMNWVKFNVRHITHIPGQSTLQPFFTSCCFLHYIHAPDFILFWLRCFSHGPWVYLIMLTFCTQVSQLWPWPWGQATTRAWSHLSAKSSVGGAMRRASWASGARLSKTAQRRCQVPLKAMRIFCHILMKDITCGDFCYLSQWRKRYEPFANQQSRRSNCTLTKINICFEWVPSLMISCKKI